MSVELPLPLPLPDGWTRAGRHGQDGGGCLSGTSLVRCSLVPASVEVQLPMPGGSGLPRAEDIEMEI